MYPFDSQFNQLALKEGFIPDAQENYLIDRARGHLLLIRGNGILFIYRNHFEKAFMQCIRENGCPDSEKYDDYKEKFIQEAIKQGFQLKKTQVNFDYDIHFINQEGEGENEIGSFFYCVHPFFIEGKTLCHAFGIFGNWKTGELHYYHADNKLIPPYQGCIITKVICGLLNETFKEDDCDSVPEPEPEPPEFATESPLDDWHKATEKDVQYLALLYLNAGAYGIRQIQLILLIPVRDINGQLINLQRIYYDGSSDFQIDSNIDGGFHRIGTPIDKTIFIAETYTKAANFHEHKTHAVAVAFCKENIENVRAVLQEKYPDYAVLLVDESDETQEINASSDPAPEE